MLACDASLVHTVERSRIDELRRAERVSRADRALPILDVGVSPTRGHTKARDVGCRRACACPRCRAHECSLSTVSMAPERETGDAETRRCGEKGRAEAANAYHSQSCGAAISCVKRWRQSRAERQITMPNANAQCACTFWHVGPVPETISNE